MCYLKKNFKSAIYSKIRDKKKSLSNLLHKQKIFINIIAFMSYFFLNILPLFFTPVRLELTSTGAAGVFLSSGRLLGIV